MFGNVNIQLQQHTISVPYKKDNFKYEVYTRPLGEWALDLLADLLLTPHFMWNAQCLYKHDGTRFECFIHEPWTANHWWDIQVSIVGILLNWDEAVVYDSDFVFMLVQITGKWCSFCLYPVYWQESPYKFSKGKSLPGDRLVCKPFREYQEQWWLGRRMYSWFPTHCMLLKLLDCCQIY